VALTIALLLGAGAGFLYGSTNERAVTSVSTTTVPAITVTRTSVSHTTLTKTLTTTLNPLTTAFMLSSDGLNFSVSINATTLSPNQWVEITASLNNTLSVNNNITATLNGYQFLGYHLWPNPAGYWHSPYLFVVLNGSYTAQSVVGLGGRGLAENGASAESATPWSYRFGPNSGRAVLSIYECTANCFNTTVGSYPSSASVIVRGYWATPLNTSNYPSPPYAFTPGTYTVAVEDEWGAVLVLHFTVMGQTAGATPRVCWVPDQTCSR